MAEAPEKPGPPATAAPPVPWRWQLAWYASKASLIAAMLVLIGFGWRKALAISTPWRESHPQLGTFLICLAVWLLIVVCCYPKRCLRHWHRRHRQGGAHG